jgi:hypothetical protein
MIHSPRNLISPTLKRTTLRVVRWAAIGMVLGAVGGAVFGGVFGVFGMLLQFEPSQIVSITGYFALCGGAAGALIGMYGAIVDDADAPELSCRSPRSTTPSVRRVEPVREFGMPTRWRPQNRLASDSTTFQLRRVIPTSQNPSRN